MSPRLMLGLDPGLENTGWGVVQQDGSSLIHIAHGMVTTKSSTSLANRLGEIGSQIRSIIAEYSPQGCSAETLYFARNKTSALSVAHARGVLLYTCAQAGLTVFEPTPDQIKKSIVGIGNAEKKQVQAMTQLLLGLPSPVKPHHSADALAAAICALQSARLYV